MYDGIGQAIDALYKLVMVLLIVAVPLALWKIVEIIIWIFTHLEIGIK